MWKRLAQAAAIAGVAAIISGAFITSSDVAAPQGTVTVISGAFTTSSDVAAPQGHPEIGVVPHMVIAFLTIALVLSAAFQGAQRIVASAAVLCLAAAAAIGWSYPLSPGAAVWHAAFAHLFVACMTVVLIARSWSGPAVPLDASAHRGLREAALITPAAVFVQIVFGALYRHQITGIMPHMLGAMVVALLTMIVSALVLQHFSQSRELKRAAILLISAVLLQVCLGIAVFMMLLLNLSATAAFVWTATAHVTTGTLVFAASVVMAMEAWRHLAPARVAQPASA